MFKWPFSQLWLIGVLESPSTGSVWCTCGERGAGPRRPFPLRANPAKASPGDSGAGRGAGTSGPVSCPVSVLSSPGENEAPPTSPILPCFSSFFPSSLPLFLKCTLFNSPFLDCFKILPIYLEKNHPPLFHSACEWKPFTKPCIRLMNWERQGSQQSWGEPQHWLWDPREEHQPVTMTMSILESSQISTEIVTKWVCTCWSSLNYIFSHLLAIK